MKYLFHLGHPAHFHLFKNTIATLKRNGDTTYVLIKKKDILEDLLIEANIDYYNILPGGRKNSKLGISIGLLKQTIRLFFFTLRKKPDLLIGSTFPIAVVGRLLGIKSLLFNEDDAEVVPAFVKLCYPHISKIIAPEVCSVGKYGSKKISYEGYHELAYLHPNHFSPDKIIVEKYIPLDSPFFVLRFSDLSAYHDEGIKGISTEMCRNIIKILKPHGNIYISSEKELDGEFEAYRIKINPLHMHHIMAFAKIFIGDSQTMAAEAGVLGTPFIRYNDFVGRISYLNEIEDKYQLGYGFKTRDIDAVYKKLEELLATAGLEEKWQLKRTRLLNDKIDLNTFMIKVLHDHAKN
ncbi:MAG: DUF354 domain-containing protein [Bacteroidota bacterium]